MKVLSLIAASCLMPEATATVLTKGSALTSWRSLRKSVCLRMKLGHISGVMHDSRLQFFALILHEAPQKFAVGPPMSEIFPFQPGVWESFTASFRMESRERDVIFLP